MILVADNLRITLPLIARAVEQQNPGPVAQLAQACQKAGAMAMDINSGPLTRDPAEKMTFLVQSVQRAVDLPLVLDTTNPKALAAGLAACDGKATINGVSLEPEKLKHVLPLAREYDCDLVGYLLRPDGHVPADAGGRMEAAVQLFAQCQQAGVTPEKLIIDPIVAPLAWPDGNRQNMAVLEVLRTLPDLLGFPVRTMAGLSNLTTGAPGKQTRSHYQQAFVPMLTAAGLDVLLMNVLDEKVTRMATKCEVITGGGVFSWGT